jgi:hypothetical protein
VKRLAALAIVVAGAVAAFAIYTVGWRDGDEGRVTPREPRVYTLRQGDIVRMPSVEVECEATHEANIPRLFCTRTRRGRYQVEIWRDSVGLYDLESPDAEPMAPTYSVPALKTRP